MPARAAAMKKPSGLSSSDFALATERSDSLAIVSLNMASGLLGQEEGREASPKVGRRDGTGGRRRGHGLADQQQGRVVVADRGDEEGEGVETAVEDSLG